MNAWQRIQVRVNSSMQRFEAAAYTLNRADYHMGTFHGANERYAWFRFDDEHFARAFIKDVNKKSGCDCCLIMYWAENLDKYVTIPED